jgi:hypothetical protein
VVTPLAMCAERVGVWIPEAVCERPRAGAPCQRRKAQRCRSRGSTWGRAELGAGADSPIKETFDAPEQGDLSGPLAAGRAEF